MRKSINPMFGLKNRGEASFRLRPESHRLDEFAPAIPWRVALLHCSPPLRRSFHLQTAAGYLSTSFTNVEIHAWTWTAQPRQTI